MPKRNETPTKPPRRPTVADCYALQMQQSEQIAVLIGMVRNLTDEVTAHHETLRVHNLLPPPKESHAPAGPVS